MSKILIAGGSGLVGTRLSKLLVKKGHEVVHLSRRVSGKELYPTFSWDIKAQTIDKNALIDTDYIVNLAGASIVGKHWTDKQKELIISSRTQANATIKKALLSTDHQVKAYLAAAAIGYYGDRGEAEMTETSPPGDSGFLPESCIAWESAIAEVAQTGIRTICIRIGIVLSTRDGALPKMMLSTHARIGSYFGDGSMYYSWIHIDDLCRIFIYALENEQIEGTFNGVAPNPVTNKELIASIGKAKNITLLMMPTPTFVIRLGMGEMAETILSSTKVSSDKIEQLGFKFEHPDLVPALQHLFQEEI